MLIFEAIKANQYSSKIATQLIIATKTKYIIATKIGLFCCDNIQYCVIKFGFLIFKLKRSALNYFIHDEAGVVNLFLNFEKKKCQVFFLQKS